MTSSRWVRTVRMNLIHGGQVGACRDRKPARVSPASGRWYSASHNASTRITARWHASLPMRRRLHSGSIMPRCHAKSGAAIHSLKDRDTCNKFNFRIFKISFLLQAFSTLYLFFSYLRVYETELQLNAFIDFYEILNKNILYKDKTTNV